MFVKKLIKKCSKYYLYILLTAVFFVLKSLVINLNDIGIYKDKNVFGINIIVNNHILMKLLIEYFGYILFGVLSKLIFDRNHPNSIPERILRNSVVSVNVKASKEQRVIQKRKLLIIASLFFSIQLIVRTILNFGSVWMLDLWIFNIFFIYIFMKYILHTHHYKHQIYALILNFTINLIILVTCSGIRHNGKNDYDGVRDNYGSYYYVILFYVVYIALSAFICSSEVLQKKLMDIYYASPYTILYMFGLISGGFTFIAYIIASTKSCGNPSKKVNFCTVKHDDYDGGNYFFDNFKIYILNMNKRLKENKTSFYLEILLVYPLYSFLCYIKYLYETLVVWHLNPNFVLLSDNI